MRNAREKNKSCKVLRECYRLGAPNAFDKVRGVDLETRNPTV